MENVTAVDGFLTAIVTYYKKEDSTKVGAMSQPILKPENGIVHLYNSCFFIQGSPICQATSS